MCPSVLVGFTMVEATVVEDWYNSWVLPMVVGLVVATVVKGSYISLHRSHVSLHWKAMSYLVPS